MPEMDGIEATAALRASELGSGKHTPVVAMTALVMKGDRERCLAVGMDGYLSKPIHTTELDDMLEKFTSIKNKHDSERELRSSAHLAVATKTIDEGDLLVRLGGDREFLAELVTLFREDYPGKMVKIRTALQQQDAAEVNRGAHSLRGPLANFSATSAAALAAEVENAAAAGDLNTASAAFGRFEPELLRAIEALSAICEERVP
jgi:CheY-like chemotaxis protein